MNTAQLPLFASTAPYLEGYLGRSLTGEIFYVCPRRCIGDRVSVFRHAELANQVKRGATVLAKRLGWAS